MKQPVALLGVLWLCLEGAKSGVGAIDEMKTTKRVVLRFLTANGKENRL